MARQRERDVTELEEGSITFYVRPRVRSEEIDSLADVQHVVIRLISNGGTDRFVVIGRKRLTDRFWAFVHAVGDDVPRALGERTEEIGGGTYLLYEHDGHAHLAYQLDRFCDESLRLAIGLSRSTGFIITVMNPDPAVWGTEVRPIQEELFPGIFEDTVQTPFPPELLARFEGRRYAKLDTPEFLNYPGAELVLISE